MTKVLIVYTTTSGNTQRMAEAIANGARSVNGAKVVLKEATETTVDDARCGRFDLRHPNASPLGRCARQEVH